VISATAVIVGTCKLMFIIPCSNRNSVLLLLLVVLAAAYAVLCLTLFLEVADCNSSLGCMWYHAKKFSIVTCMFRVLSLYHS
jgi:hypothetical protein